MIDYFQLIVLIQEDKTVIESGSTVSKKVQKRLKCVHTYVYIQYIYTVQIQYKLNMYKVVQYIDTYHLGIKHSSEHIHQATLHLHSDKGQLLDFLEYPVSTAEGKNSQVILHLCVVK